MKTRVCFINESKSKKIKNIQPPYINNTYISNLKCLCYSDLINFSCNNYNYYTDFHFLNPNKIKFQIAMTKGNPENYIPGFSINYIYNLNKTIFTNCDVYFTHYQDKNLYKLYIKEYNLYGKKYLIKYINKKFKEIYNFEEIKNYDNLYININFNLLQILKKHINSGYQHILIKNNNLEILFYFYKNIFTLFIYNVIKNYYFTIEYFIYNHKYKFNQISEFINNYNNVDDYINILKPYIQLNINNWLKCCLLNNI